jgi:hypothetical protein
MGDCAVARHLHNSCARLCPVMSGAENIRDSVLFLISDDNTVEM